MTLVIHQEKIGPEEQQQLMNLCPFGAIKANGSGIEIDAACKNCKMCVRKGPAGAVTWEEEPKPAAVDKDAWCGIAVFAEKRGCGIHPVTLELLGKAKSLAKVTGHPVYAVFIGSSITEAAKELLHYGADKVFVYDSPELADFRIGPYANAFYDFIEQIKPSSILVGATNLGRSLAPKVAARCNTGLTADCTILDMKENTDLVQIRPAFGGNIMAQIVTPNARPQFCTVRYKIFDAPERTAEAAGEIVRMSVSSSMLESRTEVISVQKKPTEIDISEAEVIVAFGRGIKKDEDIAMVKELAELLGAQLASTRPMVECGWMDPRRQIGLSGRTVKPKLLITVGISGSVQFVAGMKNSDLIVAINSDPNANIFGVAHIGLVGDLYEIVPQLIARIKEGKGNV